MTEQIVTWEITLPDGTHVLDEIEYGYGLSVTGVAFIPKRNRRTITHPDGESECVAVPENYEENRRELEAVVSEWQKAERIFEQQASKREELYIIYKRWIEEHLEGNMLSSLLFASANSAR